jgi:hypothetical protein
VPQLDLTTYITNLFWLVVVFFTFYVLVVKTFLPTILKAFIFRKYFSDLQLNSIFKTKNVYEFYINKYLLIESFSLNVLNNILAEYVYISYVYINKTNFSILLEDYSSLSIYNQLTDKEESLVEVNDFNY